MCQRAVASPFVALLVLLAPFKSSAGFLGGLKNLSPTKVAVSVKDIGPQAASAFAETKPDTHIATAIADKTTKSFTEQIQVPPQQDAADLLSQTNQHLGFVVAKNLGYGGSDAGNAVGMEALIPSSSTRAPTQTSTPRAVTALTASKVFGSSAAEAPRTMSAAFQSVSDGFTKSNVGPVTQVVNKFGLGKIHEASRVVTPKSLEQAQDGVNGVGPVTKVVNKFGLGKFHEASRVVTSKSSEQAQNGVKGAKDIFEELHPRISDGNKIKLPSPKFVPQVFENRPPEFPKTKWELMSEGVEDAKKHVGSSKILDWFGMSGSAQAAETPGEIKHGTETVEPFEASNLQWPALALFFAGCTGLIGWQLVARVNRRDQRAPILLLDAEANGWTGSPRPQTSNRLGGEETLFTKF